MSLFAVGGLDTGIVPAVMASISGSVRGLVGGGAVVAGTTMVTVWERAADCVIRCGDSEGRWRLEVGCEVLHQTVCCQDNAFKCQAKPLPPLRLIASHPWRHRRLCCDVAPARYSC